MRILVLAGGSPDLASIESALREGQIEILTPQRAPPPEALSARRWRFDDWTLDVVTRQCLGPEGRRVDLTSSEFDLLTAFLREPGRPLSRNALLRDLRGRSWTYFDRVIDTLVARLRKKIDLDSARSLIRSVRGVGYVFCANVSPEGDQ
jgi:DNA-binding response OmpR family regulator